MTGELDLLAFAGVMALGQFSLGPDMILLTRTALRDGARAGVEMALGIACGLAVAWPALALDRLPVLRESLRWAAAAYLLWLASTILREIFVLWYSGGQVEVTETKKPRGEAGLFEWIRGTGFSCSSAPCAG